MIKQALNPGLLSVTTTVKFVVLGMLFFMPLVNAATFEEGEEYELVTPAQPTTTGNKVEVVELFWYGCPHCYDFEPYIQRWKKNKPANAEFIAMPAIFRPEWALHARAYYTAAVLGVLDKMHDVIFETTHELKKHLHKEQDVAELFVKNGIKQEDFNKVFRSFAVETKVRRAMDMTRRYGAKGVPTMIVNGKYRTSASLSGSHANTIKVIDFLIKKESAK